MSNEVSIYCKYCNNELFIGSNNFYQIESVLRKHPTFFKNELGYFCCGSCLSYYKNMKQQEELNSNIIHNVELREDDDIDTSCCCHLGIAPCPHCEQLTEEEQC